MTDFIFLDSKVTSNGDSSHEIKRQLLLRRKAMSKLDSILKSKDISLLTKACIVKAMFFSIVMYGCENWTIKKAEGQRIDASKLWCWRTLLRVPWTARRSNQSILSLVAQSVKSLPAMQETQFQSLGWEDPLEKEMATHSSILAWRIPWTEETGGLQSLGSQRVRHNCVVNTGQQGDQTSQSYRKSILNIR